MRYLYRGGQETFQGRLVVPDMLDRFSSWLHQEVVDK
jgi:hypothetical protein